MSVKVIEENIREIERVCKFNRNTPEFQKLVFVDHLHKELVFEGLYDVLVCDRTAIDTLVYGLVYGIQLSPEYFTLAIRHLDTFSEVNFFRPKDKSEEITNDNFRDTNKELRNKVDEEFERILKLWGGKYNEIYK